MSVNRVFSANYLIDDFDSLDNWVFLSSNDNDFNSWSVDNNKLIGNIGKNNSSFLFSEENDFGDTLIFEFNSLNISGIDQGVLFGVKDRSSYYVLNARFPEPLWPQDFNVNQVVLWKYYNSTYHELLRIAHPLSKNVDYRFKIIMDKQTGQIEIYIDNNLVLNYVDSNIFLGGVGFWNWGGQFDKAKTINNYSNLTINSNLSLTPTPNIDPVISPKNKIIILPGLGASWNLNAIVYNQQVSNNDWRMTPFVKNYNGLIETLEKNGLERDKDFFVWNYDWRKPISEIANNLNDFINEKIGENEKVDLVGHSLGGVVARIWSQDNENDQRLNNLITIGSPSKGSLDTYEVWNGGKIIKISDFSSLAMQILLVLKNKGGIPDLEKIRSYAPVIKDLLPTEDFVIKNNGIVGISNMETKNNYLMGKNFDLVTSDLSFSSIVGVGFSTPAWVKLSNRSVYDKVLGLWPDGKPVGYNYDSGDGTVLKSSAEFGSNESVDINSNHGEIIDDGIDFLTRKLGLEIKDLENVWDNDWSDSLVFYIGSPANLEVTCGDDIFKEDNGFLIIKNKSYIDCKVKLTPTGTGVVHLVFGNTMDIDWNYLEKKVDLGKNEDFVVKFKNGDIKPTKDSKDFLISLLVDDFKTIGMKDALKYLNKNKWSYLLGRVFFYRNKNKENTISKRILDNLYLLSMIDNKCDKRMKSIKWLNDYIFGLDRIVDFRSKKGKKLSEFGALSHFNMDQLIKNTSLDLGDKKCPNYEVVRDISLGYGMEVLSN